MRQFFFIDTHFLPTETGLQQPHTYLTLFQLPKKWLKRPQQPKIPISFGFDLGFSTYSFNILGHLLRIIKGKNEKKTSGFHLPITQLITLSQNQLLEIVFSAFSFDDPSGLIISQLTFCQIRNFRTKKVFNFVNSSFYYFTVLSKLCLVVRLFRMAKSEIFLQILSYHKSFQVYHQRHKNTTMIIISLINSS